jgi:hypothetical protein
MRSTSTYSTTLGRLSIIAALAIASGAHAQLEPIEPAPPQPYEPTAPTAPAAPSMAPPDAPTQPEYLAEGQPATPGSEPGFDSGSNWGEPSDHQRIVGRVAVGFLGVTGVPVPGTDEDDDGTESTISAPTLGIRYWFNEGLGLDAGLGLGLDTAGGTSTTASTEDDLPGTSLFGLALHLGLPISPWATGHYNAVLIPEINFGFATGSEDGGPGTADDVSLTGLLFQVGLRAGAEFHLEVLDVPQATIQLTIGLGLAVEVRDLETGNGATGRSITALHLRTNLRDLGSALASGIQVFFYM